MPIPVWVLLGFAAWTLFILFTTVGVYRWSRILTGRTAIAAWPSPEGEAAARIIERGALAGAEATGD